MPVNHHACLWCHVVNNNITLSADSLFKVLLKFVFNFITENPISHFWKGRGGLEKGIVEYGGEMFTE